MTPFRVEKSAYYISRAVGVLLPGFLFRKSLSRHSRYLPVRDRRVEERVDYYNKLRGAVSLGRDASDLRQLYKERRTTYFYDLYEHARYFEPNRKFHYLFGDVRDVPDRPAFVKSRPIAGNNTNSVLLKLNKIRHFNFPRDPYPLDRKKDVLVWRGHAGSPGARLGFLQRFAENPRFDVGGTNAKDPRLRRPFMPVRAQLKYKFIASFEGVDVASNLKWILSSNSVCFMPKPKFESWFMEGKLVPGVHYVEMNADFSGVEEKMEYYLSHPKELAEIVANAQQYVGQFLDPKLERQISLLVIQKYFEHVS